MRKVPSIGLVAFILAAGCTSEPGKITGASACRGAAAASVSLGLTPVITWTPDCTVGYLSILDTIFQPTWILVDTGSAVPPLNGIRSGVTYGIVPPEAQAFAFTTASPLVSGKPYVLVLRVVDDQGGAGQLVDTLTFVP
jgi:hypothetical protein